jgi:hypothetical protein
MVLYTVLFTLKSDTPIHLKYMNSLSVTVPVPKIIAFRKFIKDDYRNMDSDQIKEISYKIIDDDGKIIIYYIRSLKFEKGTSYYYVILDDGSLLLIDGSVKDQFRSDKTIKINDMKDETSYQKYTNNKFVKIINNGCNTLLPNNTKSINYNTHLNSLTYLILMCIQKFVYDETSINYVYAKLYSFSVHYNTDEI